MKIHPLWLICILLRVSLIFIVHYVYTSMNNAIANTFILFILFTIGVGFIYKGIIGSNNEKQISNVFWHETRYLHGLLYICASYYLFNKNINMASITLFLDLLFSFLYRFVKNR